MQDVHVLERDLGSERGERFQISFEGGRRVW
jgi:hypothetical protein